MGQVGQIHLPRQGGLYAPALNLCGYWDYHWEQGDTGSLHFPSLVTLTQGEANKLEGSQNTRGGNAEEARASPVGRELPGLPCCSGHLSPGARLVSEEFTLDIPVAADARWRTETQLVLDLESSV